MKLWDKGYTVENAVDKFTVGNDRELDIHIARFDVLASKAHAMMLTKVGVMTAEELPDILLELDNLLASIEAGTFVIEEDFEDVHSKIEHVLVEKVGNAGKKYILVVRVTTRCWWRCICFIKMKLLKLRSSPRRFLIN